MSIGQAINDKIRGWDYISVTTSTNVVTYVYKEGGASGVTIATVTMTYTDSTLATLTSVAVTQPAGA